MNKCKSKKLSKINDIVEKSAEHFGKDNIILVSTEDYDLTTNPCGRNSKSGRSKWADEIVKEVYNEERKKIVKTSRGNSKGEYNFSYIKFVENNCGEIFGIVHGKSSFHCMYPSDVWFYTFDNNSKIELEKYFKKHDLKWHTKKILIVKNNDKNDCTEAYKNEKKLKALFGTFD